MNAQLTREPKLSVRGKVASPKGETVWERPEPDAVAFRFRSRGRHAWCLA